MLKLIKNLVQLYNYRVLIFSLVGRELKARYRGTILGFFWSFFNPFLLMIIYTIVFGFILRPKDPAFGASPVNYALFLFCGLLPWVWFTSSTLESSMVLMTHGQLIKKILFPAEVLPVVIVLSNLVHFLLGLPILFFFFIVLGKGFTWWVFFLPVVILIQLIFSQGLSFLVSSLTVYFKDIKDILNNLLTFWFFATPIIYPMSFRTIQNSKLLKTFLYLNPMTHIMEGYQYSLFYGSLPHWKKLSVTFAVSLFLFFFGYYVFDKLRDLFPEEV